MPCYAPLRAVLVSGPQGPRLEFSRTALGKALSLPCGRCIGCRLERARQWAVRILHETKMHDESSFLTLTYAPEHLPKDGSISVEHCQKFMKRLRARVAPRKIRFFMCGEYGEKLGRPHYHAIIFGYGFPDKVPLSSMLNVGEVRSDFQLSDSKLLTELWGLGAVRIGTVTFDSAAYVANYATKKVTGDKANAHYQGRKPEFLLMSRRPGIGRAWFDQYESDVFPSDEVVVRGVASKPPRYYVQQIESRAKAEFPPGRWSDLLKVIKDEREKAAEALQSEVVAKGGDALTAKAGILVAESRNGRRLAVRKVVAEAKASLKRRNMEK